MKKYIALIGYLVTIPIANWFINHIGNQDFPGGPHTIPVGFGFAAPSGVLLIGVALFARDYIQQQFGRKTTLIAIAIGVIISYLIDPMVATASAVAFALGELGDFAVFTKVKERSLVAAVVASGVIGGIIDSVVFLQIAFGSTMYWEGQVIGKTWMALLGGFLIWGHRAVSQRVHTVKA